MSSWVDFWNSAHSIYVNDAHKSAHARRLLEDITEWISDEDFSVLDFGCGEALYAEDLATKCSNLSLVDSSKNIRNMLISRTFGNESIVIKDVAECYKLKDESFDLIIVNSVFQYLNLDDTKNVLKMLNKKLKEHGKLVIADVIPPNLSMISDTVSLLKFAWSNGFLVISLLGLVKTYFSDYRHLRREVGLSVYSVAEFTDLLIQNGFKARLMAKNFGHNQSRNCFCATKT
ncbi:MAG: class I SAM-dependent methyltransferase [Paracoccaceae bacterium]|nr:class I SAM-dependent methyltransferase [Paracoccaceae bacterium]